MLGSLKASTMAIVCPRPSPLTAPLLKLIWSNPYALAICAACKPCTVVVAGALAEAFARGRRAEEDGVGFEHHVGLNECGGRRGGKGRR